MQTIHTCEHSFLLNEQKYKCLFLQRPTKYHHVQIKPILKLKIGRFLYSKPSELPTQTALQARQLHRFQRNCRVQTLKFIQLTFSTPTGSIRQHLPFLRDRGADGPAFPLHQLHLQVVVRKLPQLLHELGISTAQL